MMEKQVALTRARREMAALLRWVQRHRGRVLITRKGMPVGQLVPTMPARSYTVTLEPAGEDALLPLPDALMDELGWSIGDTVLVDQSVSWKLALRRADRREPL